MNQHDADLALCSGTYNAILRFRNDDTPAWTFGPVERVVLLAWQVPGIIVNGGFAYLFGPDLPGDPDYALSLDALETIGATKAAAALRAARGLFVNGAPPGDRQERARQLQGIDATTLDALDRQFWADDSITQRLAAYIRRHAAELPPPLKRQTQKLKRHPK